MIRIDTQDVLLGQQKTKRIVEIGPSNTLAVMAKRTVESKYKSHDIALSIERELLSCESNSAEVYYETGVSQEQLSKLIPSNDSVHAQSKLTSASKVSVVFPTSALAAEPAPTPAAASAIPSVYPCANVAVIQPDAAVRAKDVVLAIMAQKLKKTVEEIPIASTIKIFVGGRSTLENELVGDLINEFGTVPERAEELSISNLTDVLQGNFSGALGRQTLMMVDKLMASKMPGAFSTTVARKYLESRWGLAKGRQDSVLLAAIVAPPTSRLPSDAEAHSFFDDLAKKHIIAAGLTLDQSAEREEQHGVRVELDSAALRSISEDQKALSKKQLELYANHLQIDLRAGAKESVEAQSTIAELQSQIDLWNNEHGDVYASGIKPMVDLRKVRVYDSWWNWALQDVLCLFHDFVAGRISFGDGELVSRCIRILNRSNPKLLDVMRYLVNVCGKAKANSESYEKAGNLMNALIVQSEMASGLPMFRSYAALGPSPVIIDDGSLSLNDILNTIPAQEGKASFSAPQIMRRVRSGLEYDADSTNTYLDSLNKIITPGISFQRKNVLLTGAGQGSIGSEILLGLLSGGAKVVVTTSSCSPATMRFYQEIYVHSGGPGSQLVVVPFNQGSQQDLDALLAYIYDSTKGLGWDLDAVIPFAAISERGCEIDQIGSKSELAHRIMLTNTIRLLGAIKRYKQMHGCDTRPAQVVLPLSANDGIFGGDGLYAESKMALESLFCKWRSESWCNYLSICGASIGWTRGTGLMSDNDVLAEGIERLGVKTFSQTEMAVHILGLMSQSVVDICQSTPLYAELNGGLDKIPDLAGALSLLRKSINGAAEINRVIANEESIENLIINGATPSCNNNTIQPRANIELGFPGLPNYQTELKSLNLRLRGMVNLEKVVVITGFSELGPYGSSRTRWEMESYGVFSLEGCVEMAWIMGLIKHSRNSAFEKEKESYTGWVDAKTGEPVVDCDIRSRYEKHILQHSGIRLVEPALWNGYDPHKKQLFQEVVIQADLEPFEASKETASAFQREHGSYADIQEIPGSGSVFWVRIKKGATLMISKAIDFGNDVAGQIPTGWNPKTYGITDDIISQVDPITLYTLICTVEALLSAGITDPYEVYQYIHTSQVGNCIGTGVGGLASVSQMYRGRSLEKTVPTDILQETFVNTVGAWVNMLILSSNGPIRTPVGACATALESLDTAHDLIMTGKAKLCLVGGVDDLEGMFVGRGKCQRRILVIC